jgi:hypothetical protein
MQGELLRIITWTDQKGNNGWISVGSLVGGIFLFSTWEMNKSIRKAWLALSAPLSNVPSSSQMFE